MLKRYPHKADLKWFTDPTKDDISGIETEGQAIVHEDVACRFEPAGNSTYRSSGGHTELVYGYKVLMPNQEFVIPPTATISFKGVDMSIARVDPMQKNTVLWL
jgi:hypothetical protein